MGWEGESLGGCSKHPRVKEQVKIVSGAGGGALEEFQGQREKVTQLLELAKIRDATPAPPGGAWT